MLILPRTEDTFEGTILATGETTGDPRAGTDSRRNRFAFRVFQLCLLVLALSVGLLAFGHWYGASLSDAGHTTSDRLREIVIRNNVLTVPENAIRFKSARMDGVTLRLDLYLSWPELEGYTSERRDDFNHVDGTRVIIFLTFEEQVMSRDMSSRLEPVYRQIIEARSVAGPNNVRFHRFKKESGFAGEVLAIAEAEDAAQPFVARCLTGTAAKEALAPCERDIAIGNSLSLTYRFPASLLGEWQVLDQAVRRKASRLLNTPG
ncbi:hypothetical protein ACFPOD_12585 [Nitratireductor kimnyeongensis]|uniref:Transmembrane anchored protein n=1 Tax=Nitratireductor kimnyeongensis TaxID=430679 RepID=A0ABW0TBR6_9HYPH|nr:hypothetical protein [Nitratireductor kimnyeongensis]QZZ35652.1 hypothetical protein KW403_00215 [Nitratireductor kimnyeongensis]